MADLFDFQHLLDEFTAAKTADNHILIDHYVEAFTDLSRFFVLLGTAFGFVSKDINEKVGILRAHRAEHPDQFLTVQSMVSHEVAGNLTTVKTGSGLPSGSRTLLRLHRTLDFVARFLGRLENLADGEYTGGPAKEEYDRTLAKFHPWFIRKMAGLAMYTLPTRGVFVDKYCKHEKEVLVPLIEPTVAVMMEIYELTQTLYSENELLNLP